MTVVLCANQSVMAEEPGEEAIRLARSITLSDEQLDSWQVHISPSPEELRWRQIAWLPTFSEGLVQADARQLPLLLWVMNGHPLGCT